MDDLERQLRDLGESVEKRLGDTSVVPRRDVQRRAHSRRVVAVFGSAVLTVGVAVASFTGVSAMVGRTVPTADPRILSSAAQATELQGTARTRLEMVMKFGIDGRSSESISSGQGEIDFGRNRSHLVLNVSGEGPARHIEVIQDGLITYTLGLPETEGWVRSEAASAGGIGSEGIRAGDYLDYLNDVSDRVEVLGQEVIDGQSVTKYRGEIDPERASEELSDEATEMLGDFEIEYTPFDVWIDAQGLVRQMSFGVHVEGEAGGQSLRSEMAFTMSYFDFGIPVDIELPDETEVTEPEPAGASASPQADASSAPSEHDGFMLLSEDGMLGPNARIGLDTHSFCVFNLPEWVETAELVDEGSDQVMVTIGGFRLSDTETGVIGCIHGIHEGVPDGLGELESDPESLILRLIGDSQSEDIEIVRAFRS